jgi:hypothetical protein
MKKSIKKLQLQKRTITHLQLDESRVLNAGNGSLPSRIQPCAPTFLCVTIMVCPTTTMPSANCPGDL